MKNTRRIEVTVGIFVAVGIAALLMLAINVSNVTSFNMDEKYVIRANFDNISGLKERSSVTIAGVNIGRVTKITVDPLTFEAIVEMHISNQYNEIPMDSSAAIYTAGLLGEKYVGIEPGGAPDYLVEGSEIRLTQSSLVLEKMIAHFLLGKTSEDE